MEPAVAGGYRRVCGGLPASAPASSRSPLLVAHDRLGVRCIAGEVDGGERDVSRGAGQ